MANSPPLCNIPFPVQLRGVEDYHVDGLEPCQPISVFPDWKEESWSPKSQNSSARKKSDVKIHPLFEFAFLGDVKNGKQEIGKGADPSMKDSKGICPLMVASQEGHLEFVEFLLDAGANIKQQNDMGRTSLFFAVTNNHLEVAKLLCRSDIVNMTDKDGASVGIHCARRGHTDMLQFLCEAKLDVNIEDENSRTALMGAAQHGGTECVEILLKNGAITNHQSESGATALLIAASFSHTDVINCLTKAEDINLCDKAGRSPLLICCSKGEVEIVKNMSEVGADVNHQNGNGMSSLTVAVCQSNVQLVEFLVRNKANKYLKSKYGLTAMDFAHMFKDKTIIQFLQPEPSEKKPPYSESSLFRNKQALCILVYRNRLKKIDKFQPTVFQEDNTRDEYSPLMVAAQKGNVEATQMLLDKGVKVNEQLPNGTTALAVAIAKDHVAVFEKLIENGADINQTDKDGQTLLFKCAADGNLYGLVKLERLGASIDKRNQEGETPLMAATVGGHVNIVKYLWKMTAQIDTKNKDGYSALDLAMVYEKQEVVELLKDIHDVAFDEEHELGHQLVQACLQASIDHVKFLVQNGAPVNFRDPEFDMKTPLICAIKTGDLAIVEFLVKRGASVNLKGIDCRTPLFHASLNGHAQIVKYLIKQGANVNVGDKIGYTALMCACQNGFTDIVQHLVKHRALVNRKDADGKLALLHAIRHSQAQVIDELLKTGLANVNAVDSKNRSMLGIACAMEKIEIIQILLNHGVDINDQLNEKRKTPLMIATVTGNLEIVKLLVNHGASVEKVNYRGLQAHEIAEKEYQMEIHAYLVEKYAEKYAQRPNITTTIDGTLNTECSSTTSEAKDQQIEKKKQPFSGKAEGEKNLLDMCTKDWGFEDLIKFSVEAGADINCKNKDELTPALIAVRKGYFKYIPWLIKYGADMNCQDEKGLTPLMHSLLSDQYAVIYTILENCTNVDVQDVEGRTALMIALKRSMFEVVPELVKKTVDINLTDKENNSVLSYCAMNEACGANIVMEICDRGANVNCMNIDGDTPLLLTLKYENVTLAEVLLKVEEVDIIHKNKFEEDAFFLASQTLRYCFVEPMAHLHDFFDPLCLGISLRILASNFSNDCIHVLLQHGLDINREYTHGQTLCFASVYYRNLQLLESLVMYGAHIDHQNNGGQTVAMLVSETEDVEFTKAILNLKPNLSLMDHKGHTAVDISLTNGNYSFCLIAQETLRDTELPTAEYVFCTIPEDMTSQQQDFPYSVTSDTEGCLGMLGTFNGPQDGSLPNMRKTQKQKSKTTIQPVDPQSTFCNEDKTCNNSTCLQREEQDISTEKNKGRSHGPTHSEGGIQNKPSGLDEGIKTPRAVVNQDTVSSPIQDKATRDIWTKSEVVSHKGPSVGIESKTSTTDQHYEESQPAGHQRPTSRGVQTKTAGNSDVEKKTLVGWNQEITKADIQNKEIIAGVGLAKTQQVGNLRTTLSCDQNIAAKTYENGNRSKKAGIDEGINRSGGKDGPKMNQTRKFGCGERTGMGVQGIEEMQKWLPRGSPKDSNQENWNLLEGGNQVPVSGEMTSAYISESSYDKGFSQHLRTSHVRDITDENVQWNGSLNKQGVSSEEYSAKIAAVTLNSAWDHDSTLLQSSSHLSKASGVWDVEALGSVNLPDISTQLMSQINLYSKPDQLNSNTRGHNHTGIPRNQTSDRDNVKDLDQEITMLRNTLQSKDFLVTKQVEMLTSYKEQIAMLKNKVAEKEQEIGMLHARLLRRKNSTQRNREEEFSFQELEIKLNKVEKQFPEIVSENKALRLKLQDFEDQNELYISETEQLREALNDKDKVIQSLQAEIADKQAQTDVEHYKTPEEDKSHRWQLCACKENTCATCVAEKAATAVPPGENAWNYNPTFTDAETTIQYERQPPTDVVFNADETRMVDIVTTDSRSQNKGLIYRFHMTISNSAMSDRGRPYCSSCSLAALLFAHKYKVSPCQLYSHLVTDELFSQIKKSIIEGTQICKVNFDQKTTHLEPKQTLLLCSDLHLKMVDEVSIDAMVTETMLHHIMNLEQDQIVLFYRMEHYKVLSIITTEDGQKVLIFDPQWHSETDRDGDIHWYGAYLFCSGRTMENANIIMKIIWSYCGDMKGKTRLAVLKMNSDDNY